MRRTIWIAGLALTVALGAPVAGAAWADDAGAAASAAQDGVVQPAGEVAAASDGTDATATPADGEMDAEKSTAANPSNGVQSAPGASATAEAPAVDSATAPSVDSGSDSAVPETPEVPVVKNGLVTDEDGALRFYQDGTYLKNAWKVMGTDRYYFGEDGAALSGWQEIAGKKYYFNEKTHIALRYRQTIQGARYYFNGSGVMQTGLVTWNDDKTSSYFDPKTGKAIEGFKTVTVKGKKQTFYFNPDNVDHRSARYEQVIKGKRYYFNKNGYMQTGWVNWRKDGRRSYFDPKANGAAVTSEWRTISGKKYYFGADGRAARYATTIKGKRYYFDSDSQMHTGLLTWKADGRKSYYGSDGVQRSGLIKVNGKYYYFDPKAAECKSVRYEKTVNGKKYYFDGKTYAAQTGWLKWKKDGTWSYYNSNGQQVTGWLTLGSKKYYINPKTARRVTYSQKIGGKSYYFSGEGVMHTGWLQWKTDGKWSYFNGSGVQLFGKQTIAGKSYNFGKSGKTSVSPQGYAMSKKAQSYSSKTNWLILVDSSTNYVGIFKGSKGNWILQRYIRCSSGAPGSRTVTGQFTVTGKGYSFGHGYTCYYYTQFYGDYLFHSILYNQGTRVVQDGRLGMNISHGCVRLAIGDAKWIYDNIPYGTKVVSYR